MIETTYANHIRGATASATQRGSSTFLMFYGQRHVNELLNKLSVESNLPIEENGFIMSGFSGSIAGGRSAFIHSIFEPMKIRNENFKLGIYYRSLNVMVWRHAIFDGNMMLYNM